MIIVSQILPFFNGQKAKTEQKPKKSTKSDYDLWQKEFDKAMEEQRKITEATYKMLKAN